MVLSAIMSAKTVNKGFTLGEIRQLKAFKYTKPIAHFTYTTQLSTFRRVKSH